MVTGVTGTECIRQHYTVVSAHCAKWVSLPSAKLELMIRVSPRTFGGEPSAFVRPGISRFLADLRPRLPTAHLWMGVRVGVDPGIPWHQSVSIAATTAVASQTTRHESAGCGCVSLVDWRLAAGQHKMVWVCCCCRLAGVAPANNTSLTRQYFCMRKRWWYNKCTDILYDVQSTVGSPVS